MIFVFLYYNDLYNVEQKCGANKRVLAIGCPWVPFVRLKNFPFPILLTTF